MGYFPNGYTSIDLINLYGYLTEVR